MRWPSKESVFKLEYTQPIWNYRQLFMTMITLQFKSVCISNLKSHTQVWTYQDLDPKKKMCTLQRLRKTWKMASTFRTSIESLRRTFHLISEMSILQIECLKSYTTMTSINSSTFWWSIYQRSLPLTKTWSHLPKKAPLRKVYELLAKLLI